MSSPSVLDILLIDNPQTFAALLDNEVVFLLYGRSTCSPCQTLKGKLRVDLPHIFPLAKLAYVDLDKTPALAAQQQILSVPSLQVYLAGKLQCFVTGTFSLHQLYQQFQRPYHIFIDRQ